MLKRIMEYQKTFFESAYTSMVILQAQAGKFTMDIWPKSCVPGETLVVYNNALNEYKKIRNKFKHMMDESFRIFDV